MSEDLPNNENSIGASPEEWSIEEARLVADGIYNFLGDDTEAEIPLELDEGQGATLTVSAIPQEQGRCLRILLVGSEGTFLLVDNGITGVCKAFADVDGEYEEMLENERINQESYNLQLSIIAHSLELFED